MAKFLEQIGSELSLIRSGGMTCEWNAGLHFCHVEDYFDLAKDELLACNILLKYIRDDILKDDPSVEGFNIGVNSGAVAGQSVFHCHIHLIPRRPGDVDNPRGGVRHVIPGKGNY